MAEHIGRFEIRRELGRGTHSVVYLGFDPHLQREVAIKTLHLGGSNPDQRSSAEHSRLMTEARTVSKLRHANIVPIFEAGEDNGDPYLVFEYVDGRSLDQLLRVEGALGPVRAAEIMQAVLGSLVAAHAQGISHRNLKPSNILIDTAGQPRVMDFGISMGVTSEQLQAASGTLLGTPAYMAPEYVLSGIVSPACDIYAAGLILLEMLTGRRAVEGKSVAEMLKRVATEPLTLPADMAIDERLGSIVLRACAHAPAERYVDAEQLLQALTGYLGVVSEQNDGGWNAKKQSTMEFLLRRMRHKTDFPALSDSVATINRLTASEKESINSLSGAILRDFGLTNKILRLVNSAYYRQVSGGNISTVSRASIVLGFDAIRNIALTIILFEHLQNKGNASQLKEAFLRSNFAGLLAREMCASIMPREVEEAFICSLFFGLGRLLAQYYFPEEVDEIVKVMQQKKCSDDAAAAKVLGISFEDLGVGIARSWGFPKGIVASMRKLPAGPVRKPLTQDETMHIIACFSNELCDAIAGTAPEDRRAALRRIGERYANSLKFSDDQLKEILEKSLGDLAQVGRILRVNLKQSPFVRQAKIWAGEPQEEASYGSDTDMLDSTMVLGVEAEEFGHEAAGAVTSAVESDAQTILSAGIQDISASLVEDVSLNDILRITLETIYRAMGFGRVLLCLREAKSNQMVGRFGFGTDTNELARNFRFSLTSTTDVFYAAVAKGLDLLISDVDEPKIAARIPEWYSRHFAAKTFVLFPLVIRGKPVALIYCDKEKAGEIVIAEKELSLLKTLRNQAVLAMKQGA